MFVYAKRELFHFYKVRLFVTQKLFHFTFTTRFRVPLRAPNMFRSFTVFSLTSILNKTKKHFEFFLSFHFFIGSNQNTIYCVRSWVWLKSESCSMQARSYIRYKIRLASSTTPVMIRLLFILLWLFYRSVYADHCSLFYDIFMVLFWKSRKVRRDRS